MMYSVPIQYRVLTTEYTTTLCSPHPTKSRKTTNIGPFRPLRPKQFNNTFNNYYVIFKPDKNPTFS